MRRRFGYLPRRQTRRLVVLGIGLVVAGLTSVAQDKGWLKTAGTAAQKAQPGLYQVTEFVDGDTIAVDMNGHGEKIRFIGVDTPETHDPRKSVQCFGQVAAEFTKSFIVNNNVRLEADPLDTNRDRYDRLLRYVYLPDGRMVNSEIIKQGYGFAYTGFPFTKSVEFVELQRHARENKLGLWSSCKPIINTNGGYSSE